MAQPASSSAASSPCGSACGASCQNDRAAWIKGAASCSAPPAALARPWRLVLLGAPGVGKGTQADLLKQHFQACHLSTGDVFRAAKSAPPGQRSPAMTSALEYMRRGDLVPDDTVLDMVRERRGCLRCQGGFLLDGFPRTVNQARALQQLLADENVNLDAAINYELPIDEVVARLSGRRTCAGCKAVYHVATRPPRNEGVCDQCGQTLVQREDDRPESVRVRMEAYATSTAPLTEYYAGLGQLLTIAADGAPDEIFQRTLAALPSRG